MNQTTKTEIALNMNDVIVIARAAVDEFLDGPDDLEFTTITVRAIVACMNAPFTVTDDDLEIEIDATSLASVPTHVLVAQTIEHLYGTLDYVAA